jgi:hypothetical protein
VVKDSKCGDVYAAITKETDIFAVSNNNQK